MPESPSTIRESNSRISQRSENDLELQAKRTGATTTDFRRYLVQGTPTTFRRPFATNLKDKRPSKKSTTADRGSWWRVHLRVGENGVSSIDSSFLPSTGHAESRLLRNAFEHVHQRSARSTDDLRIQERRTKTRSSTVGTEGQRTVAGCLFLRRFCWTVRSFSPIDVIVRFSSRTNRLPSSYPFKGPQREEVLQRAISARRDKVKTVEFGFSSPLLTLISLFQEYRCPSRSVRNASLSTDRSTGRIRFVSELVEVSPKVSSRLFLDTVSSNQKPRGIQSFASVNRTIGRTRRRISSFSFQHFAPAPGEYDIQMTDIDVNRSFIRSPFRSSTDRFYARPTNVPGPGTYEKLTNFPSLRQVHRFSARGVYFDGNFCWLVVVRINDLRLSPPHARCVPHVSPCRSGGKSLDALDLDARSKEKSRSLSWSMASIGDRAEWRCCWTIEQQAVPSIVQRVVNVNNDERTNHEPVMRRKEKRKYEWWRLRNISNDQYYNNHFDTSSWPVSMACDSSSTVQSSSSLTDVNRLSNIDRWLLPAWRMFRNFKLFQWLRGRSNTSNGGWNPWIYQLSSRNFAMRMASMV